MNLTIAIAKDPHEVYGDMNQIPEGKSEKGNSILDNDWKLECIESLNEILDKLKGADGKEAIEAANHIEMAISTLDPQNDESKKIQEEDKAEGGEEDVTAMEDTKKKSDYMDKFQDD